MLREIAYLESKRARIGLVVHQQVEHGCRLQIGEVAGTVGHRTVGYLQQHLERGPRLRAKRYDDGPEKIHQLDGALDASSHAQEMPSGPAGNVLHFDPAQRSEYSDTTIQNSQCFARGCVAPGRSVRGAKLADDTLRITRKAVADVRRRPRGAAQNRVQAVAPLFLENQRKDFLFQVPPLVQMALEVPLREPRV